MGERERESERTRSRRWSPFGHQQRHASLFDTDVYFRQGEAIRVRRRSLVEERVATSENDDD